MIESNPRAKRAPDYIFRLCGEYDPVSGGSRLADMAGPVAPGGEATGSFMIVAPRAKHSK